MNGGLSVSPRAGAASFSSAVSSFAVAVSQVEIPVEADSGPSHRADLVAPKSNSAHRQRPWRRMMRFANPRHAHAKEGFIDVAVIGEELCAARLKVAGSEGRDRAFVASDPRACDVDRDHRCEAQEDEQDVVVLGF